MARDFLKEVVLEKQKAIKEAKRRYPERELRLRLEEPHIYRPFKDILAQEGPLHIIAEIKKASPSEGLLREGLDPIQLSRIYENCGCSAVSILTEEKYFLGKIAHLNQVRKIISLPILRKDFIFEPYQLYESKFFGADAVLLIAELLKGGELLQFLSLSKRLELDCLVEVNNLEDLDYALEQGSEIIGLNSRNLHTLEVDKKSVSLLIKHIPGDKLIVLESGIKTHRDYEFGRNLNVNALLIGSAFIRCENIKEKFKEIVEGKIHKPKVTSRKKRLGKTAAGKELIKKAKSK